MLELATPVKYVKGIGPRIAQILAAKGIHTVDDLLHYLPFRYEDRLNPRGINELRAGEMASVIGEVRNSGLFRTRRMPIFQLTIGQGRSRLRCLWFHGAYLQDKFKAGQMVALYGKVEQDQRSGELQIIQPQIEMLGDPAEQGSDGAERKAAESLEIGRIVPHAALVSPRHSDSPGKSDAGSSGAHPRGSTFTPGTGLAPRGSLDGALARAGREPAGLAVLAYSRAYPADF
jgi:ATP-dependent DNA helicase RecG